MKFLNFGYYIAEPAPTLEWSGVKCRQILTATDCICNLHPNMKGSFWISANEDSSKQHDEYQKLLGISDDEFSVLKEFVARLFDVGKIDVDGRFVDLADAAEFSVRYLANIPAAKIISLHLSEDFREEFVKGLPKMNAPIFADCTETTGEFLGYDILGWDWGAFHSFHCNALTEVISEKYCLELNDFGLIQNSYSQVKEFAEYIDGKGEPVLWLPFAVYEQNYSTCLA
jgi:hypothetical protein